jgi:cell division protein FtsQ
MARNLATGAMVDEKTKNHQRRRYYVALGIPGAEVRLPSLPRVRIGWRLLSALTVVGLVSLLYMLWSAPEFKVSSVEVKGLQRLSPAEINAIMDVSDQVVFAINPQRLERDIHKAFPEMAAVTVTVNLPAEVIVTVDERLPILIWQEGDRELWLDVDGVAFPPRGEPGALPRVEVQNTTVPTTSVGVNQVLPVPYVKPDLVSAIVLLGTQVPKKATLVYDGERGPGWREKKGTQVYFGKDMQDIDLKLRVYAAIVARLKEDDINPLLISIENVHAPYIRVER